MKKKFNIFTSLDKLATEIPVSEIMVIPYKTLKETDTAKDGLDLMIKYSISGLIITNEENYPIAIVSEGDLLKKVFYEGKNPSKVKLSEIMTRHPYTIGPDANIGETAVLMNKHKISRLPVVKDKKLVGYVTKSDLMEKLNEIYYQNTRLKYLPLVFMVMLIIIAVLLVVIMNNP